MYQDIHSLDKAQIALLGLAGRSLLTGFEFDIRGKGYRPPFRASR